MMPIIINERKRIREEKYKPVKEIIGVCVVITLNEQGNFKRSS